MTWVRYSRREVTWGRRCAPTGRALISPAEPVAGCRSWALHTWAWPRACANGTSWRPLSTMPPRASRCAGRSPTPGRWPPALPPWPGSGRRKAMRPVRWTRSARPSWSSRAQRWLRCSTRCRCGGGGAGAPPRPGRAPPAGGTRRGRGLRAGDEPSWPREGEYLVLARVLLADHAPGQALKLLQRLFAQAAAQGRTGSVIEIRALQALAHQAAGDQAGALAALTEALAL